MSVAPRPLSVGDEATKSLWMREKVAWRAPRLGENRTCDTVVVGAGIAGLSVAYELTRAGQSVIVLDRGAIARGMTARTTAHLAPVCDDSLSALIDMRGETLAIAFQRSQEAAVDRIEAIVREHGLKCNFRRLDAFLFPASNMETKEARETVEKEYKAARQLDVEAERVKGVPLKGFENAPVLRYGRQGTFHPLKYLQGLAREIMAGKGRLFQHSPVTRIEGNSKSVKVTTEAGASVSAANLVVATNSPINKRVELHSKMAPYRTYAMAFTLPRGTLPDALFWDMGDPYHYVRLNPGRGWTDYLIAGGSDHKTGETDQGAVRFEAIEAWIRALVPKLGREVHRWSGQVLDTIDYCGFIGRDPESERIFLATGDSGQGITHGALAGLLLKDLITSDSSPWKEVYEPSRRTGTGVVNYIRENVTAIKNFAEHLLPAEIDSLDDLKAGDGGIIQLHGKKVAASRDAGGKLHLVSAVCTHLGCHVHWNSTEASWDCPCHGSQFAADGAVLNGPAISPLEAVSKPSK